MILWSYGTGNTGVGAGELSGPHMAEENPLDSNEIVVDEEYGCDVLLINRTKRTHRVIYGTRGVAGGGTLLNRAHSAHFIASGPYKGNVIITEYSGDHRVMIINKNNKEVLWSYIEFEHPMDAIYWDDEHIMVTEAGTGIF